MAATVALALLIALIPDCLCQFLCLGLQQLVEGFFYASTYKFLELPLDNYYNKFGQEHRIASPVFFPSHA